MANKNNIRSIRISDELADLIDRQVGRTFTERYENLITRCVWELPAKEAELETVQAAIDRERQELERLRAKVISWRQTARLMVSAIDQMEDSIKMVIANSRNV